MLLVVFGAGASYDSVAHHPPVADLIPQSCTTRVNRLGPHEQSRPPLANQLFEDRGQFVSVMNNYPACKPLISRLRGQVQVERQLARFQEEGRKYPARWSQLAAIRYYLHEMLWMCQNQWKTVHYGITNYSTFIDEIERWRYEKKGDVCYVSFNYDTMLENSVSELWRWDFNVMTAYVSRPNYRFIKLHGSIDWGLEFQKVPGSGSPTDVINAASEGTAVWGTSIEKVGIDMRVPDRSYRFPAIAIPVEKKDEFVCPRPHLEFLADALPRVTKIITVGWRASEDKFLGMLKSPLTGLQKDVDLMVVSGSMAEARETASNLGMDAATGRKRSLLDNGFTGLINETGLLDHFLKD